MKIENVAIILLILLISSCTNSQEPKTQFNASPNNIIQDSIVPINCSAQIVIDSKLYSDSLKSNLSINQVRIDGNCIMINYSSGGCDGSTWNLKLIGSDIIEGSYPETRGLKLVLENNETCEMDITKDIAFDLANIKMDNSSTIQLSLQNWDKSITFSY